MVVSHARVLLSPGTWEHLLSATGAAAAIVAVGLLASPSLRGAVAARLAPAPGPATGERADVALVIDGDTFVTGAGATVRILGVDAPETVNPNMTHPQPFGQEAADRLRSLIAGRSVVLERDTTDTDHYGRLLRHVWLDGNLVGETLVAEGLARASAVPPDVRHADRLSAAQERARAAGRGLWSAPRPTPIGAFRTPFGSG